MIICAVMLSMVHQIDSSSLASPSLAYEGNKKKSRFVTPGGIINLMSFSCFINGGFLYFKQRGMINYRTDKSIFRFSGPVL